MTKKIMVLMGVAPLIILFLGISCAPSSLIEGDVMADYTISVPKGYIAATPNLSSTFKLRILTITYTDGTTQAVNQSFTTGTDADKKTKGELKWTLSSSKKKVESFTYSLWEDSNGNNSIDTNEMYAYEGAKAIFSSPSTLYTFTVPAATWKKK